MARRWARLGVPSAPRARKLARFWLVREVGRRACWVRNFKNVGFKILTHRYLELGTCCSRHGIYQKVLMKYYIKKPYKLALQTTVQTTFGVDRRLESFKLVQTTFANVRRTLAANWWCSIAPRLGSRGGRPLVPPRTSRTTRH